jgi:hypothetical protein
MMRIVKIPPAPAWYASPRYFCQIDPAETGLALKLEP